MRNSLTYSTELHDACAPSIAAPSLHADAWAGLEGQPVVPRMGHVILVNSS